MRFSQTTEGDPIDCGDAVLVPRLIDGALEGYEFEHRGPSGACVGWVPTVGDIGWVVTGEPDKPTLRPSLLCRICEAHGFITDGVWQSVREGEQ